MGKFGILFVFVFFSQSKRRIFSPLRSKKEKSSIEPQILTAALSNDITKLKSLVTITVRQNNYPNNPQQHQHHHDDNNPEIDINWGNEQGVTPFIAACSAGHVGIVEYLLSHPKIDVNRGTKEGLTGFMGACAGGYEEIVGMLLRDGRVIIQKATWDAETPFVAAKTDRIRGMILNHRIPSFPLLFLFFSPYLLNFSLFLNFSLHFYI